MKLNEENIIKILNESIFNFQVLYGSYPLEIKISFDLWVELSRACIKKSIVTPLPKILVDRFSNIPVTVDRKKTDYLQII